MERWEGRVNAIEERQKQIEEKVDEILEIVREIRKYQKSEAIEKIFSK